jgi:fatty-acyl-CoA synthase
MAADAAIPRGAADAAIPRGAADAAIPEGAAEGAAHPAFVADADPDRPAITLVRDGADVLDWTYGDLERRANRLARHLRRAGLGAGDGIAVLVGNRPEVFVAFWAAMRIGLYFTPVSIHLKREEVRWILTASRAKALLLAPELAAEVPDDARPAVTLDADGLDAIVASEADTRPADAVEGAPLLFSSGTTGRPKGVINLRPGAPLGTRSELARRRMALHGIDADTVYLSTAPLYHSAPLRYTEMVLRAGGRVVVMAHFDAAESLALIERHRISHSQWVPTMFVRLLRLPEAERTRHDLSSHRVAVHAAAPCPVEVKRAMLDWWGPIVHEYYSATEANGQTVIGPGEWLAHPGSVGRPLVGEVHIRDDDGRDLPPGETGLVHFRDGGRFEYLDDPEKTAAAHAPDGASTLGDIGHLDADGYLYLTDRRDATIITGGVNVWPREVEDTLLGHPAVVDACVLGLPDPEFGERVHAEVELVTPEAATADELIAHCRARIAHLKCPRSIHLAERLPRLPTGKLKREPLKAAAVARMAAADRASTHTEPDTPQDPEEGRA